MKHLVPLLGVLVLCPLPTVAQTSSTSSSSSTPVEPETGETNPETQVHKAYPGDPSKIPLTSADGKTTTLAAMAPKVLLVSVFTSRFGDMLELKRAPLLMKALAGNKDVAFIGLNVDRPRNQEDWDTLREVMKENGVDEPVYSDTRLSFLAWVNGRPEEGKSTVIRIPSLAIVLNGKQLYDTYGIDPGATPEAHVAERMKEVKEALKAAEEKPKTPGSKSKAVGH